MGMVDDDQMGKLLMPMPFGIVACPCSQAFLKMYEFEALMEKASMGIDEKFRCVKCDRLPRDAW